MLGDSAPLVLVLTVRWVLINVLDFFLFVFDSACVCVWVLINVFKKKPTKFCINFFIF